MSKAYLTPPKAIRLANGSRMQHGQIIGGNTMHKNPQRPLNSASPMKSLTVGNLPAAPSRTPSGEASGDIARMGAPKNIVEAAPGHLQRSRTVGEPHPYLHGQTVQDEPNVPLKTYEQKIPLHPATTAKQRAAVHPVANDPNVILQDAANLGRKA